MVSLQSHRSLIFYTHSNLNPGNEILGCPYILSIYFNRENLKGEEINPIIEPFTFLDCNMIQIPSRLFFNKNYM
jgi:hypothetical protein